jgi:1-acyl-sn-glycerol-3-phosphate acyltransferase
LLNKVISALFSNWLAVTFYALFHALYDIRIEGLANYTASPATLITINHKRDLDIPIVASILHLSKTPFNENRRMHFVARDDLFHPGFLTAHFPIFGIAGPLIHRINIKPVMTALRAHPISHLIRRRIGPLIRELEQTSSTIPLKEVVNQPGFALISAMLGERKRDNLGDVTVADFLGYSFSSIHQQFADIQILRDDYSRKLRKRTLNKVSTQLQEITEILNKGNICMLAPEGQLSPDGRFWPVKSGLFRLISMTTSNIRILPVNTTYDFMTLRRMRIYMTVGHELTELKGLHKISLEQSVQKSIVTSGPVTLSHLGSEFLLNVLDSGQEQFKEQECHMMITRRVKQLRNENMRLEERLLTEKSLQKRIDDFLRYCVKKDIINKKEGGSFVVNTRAVKMHTFNKFHENPVQYSANELRSLLEWHNHYDR